MLELVARGAQSGGATSAPVYRHQCSVGRRQVHTRVPVSAAAPDQSDLNFPETKTFPETHFLPAIVVLATFPETFCDVWPFE